METLHQIFMTVIAAVAFFILIAKIASAVTNGDTDHHRHSIRDFSKVLAEELKPSKTKSKKKVRFAIDRDEFLVNDNQAVAGPSETKPVVSEKNHGEIEDDFGDVNTDYDDNKAKEESMSSFVVDYDQIKDGKSEETMICEENVGIGNENQMRMKILLCDDVIDEDAKEKVGLISDKDDSSDDDWEGVERSELEKVFAMAADYGKVEDNLQSLEGDIQMQLYGLYKVATEGPCHEAQPMALKVSARAKWNVWQKLGNMNPDVAMELYITLLSEKLPGWSQGCHSVDKNFQ